MSKQIKRIKKEMLQRNPTLFKVKDKEAYLVFNYNSKGILEITAKKGANANQNLQDIVRTILKVMTTKDGYDNMTSFLLKQHEETVAKEAKEAKEVTKDG